MSDRRRFRWDSGRLGRGPIQDFWQISVTVQDPEVPNLPLETPATGGPTIIEADGASAGSSSVTGVGAAVFAGVGASEGVSTPAAVGAAIFATVGASTGSSDAQAITAAIVAATGASESTSEALAEMEDAQVVSPPEAPASIGGGGGGGGSPSFHRKRAGQSVREWVDELYAELTAPEMPKSVKREAGRIVRPFAEAAKAKVPAVSAVDWDALVEEAQKVRALLDLWERTVQEADLGDEEEEMAAIMGAML